MLNAADPTLLAEATTLLSMRTPDENPGTISLAPVVEGEFLRKRALVAFRDGRAHGFPLVVGRNEVEGGLGVGRVSAVARRNVELNFALVVDVAVNPAAGLQLSKQ